MKRIINTVILFALMIVLAPASYAEEQYQTEIGTSFRKFDSRSNQTFTIFGMALSDSEATAYGLTGEVFFTPVNTANHLLGEAAFLERSGSVFIGYQHVEQKLGTLKGAGPELQFAVNYVRPGLPLTAQAFIEDSKIHYTAGSNGDLKVTTYGINVGDYFTDGLLAGIGFEGMKTEDSSRPFFPYFTTNSDTQGWQLFLTYVHELDRGRGIKLEAKGGVSRTKTDRGPAYLNSSSESISMVYYWTRALGTGVEIQNTDGVYFPEGLAYTANVTYFVTPQFSINGIYDSFRTSGSAGDSNTYNITLAARF